MFSINFLPKSTDDASPESSNTRVGRIVIGDFSEQFESSLSYWGVDKYQENWKRGVERLQKGAGKSCMITSMHDPKIANFIIWWPMYLENGLVYFQNHLLFLNELTTEFNPEDPYVHVRNRRTVNDDNIPISEWEVPLDALARFMM